MYSTSIVAAELAVANYMSIVKNMASIAASVSKHMRLHRAFRIPANAMALWLQALIYRATVIGMRSSLESPKINTVSWSNFACMLETKTRPLSLPFGFRHHGHVASETPTNVPERRPAESS